MISDEINGKFNRMNDRHVWEYRGPELCRVHTEANTAVFLPVPLYDSLRAGGAAVPEMQPPNDIPLPSILPQGSKSAFTFPTSPRRAVSIIISR